MGNFSKNILKCWLKKLIAEVLLEVLLLQFLHLFPVCVCLSARVRACVCGYANQKHALWTAGLR